MMYLPGKATLFRACVAATSAFIVFLFFFLSSKGVKLTTRDRCGCADDALKQKESSPLRGALENEGKRQSEAWDCQALMEGDPEETNRTILWMESNPRRSVEAEEIRKEAEDCDSFRRMRRYDVFPVSNEERAFPIAFSIIMHKSVDQLERLLRVIYRSHNSYCIHVDRNSNQEILNAVQAISKCFSNVFIPSDLEAITYAHFSRLQADISCMSELVLRALEWKYLINLTGQMFPLKTNLEIVKILQTYGGLNDIEGLSVQASSTPTIKSRYQHSYKVADRKMIKTRKAKEPPPHNITIVKGVTFGAFSRPFVQYVLEAPIVQDFLNWTRDTYSPDEFFWSSLNSRWVNPMFLSPGGFNLPPERKPLLATYVAWNRKGASNCGGKFVRNICIFGASDLQNLIRQKNLFVNKLYIDFQHAAMDCLEEWLENKTKRHLPMDLVYYRDLHRGLRIQEQELANHKSRNSTKS